MYRNLPNQLTVLRLILAGVFFLVLGDYRYPIGPRVMLLIAMGIFIVASITDWLDGYLARKWNVESTFGRIMDPFCDKVLVIGAFIYLAGPRFVDKNFIEPPEPTLFNIAPGNMISGIYPWMVALILARELLVTSIRGELEGQGVKFGANIFGKLKLILQVIVVPIILFIVWLDPEAPNHRWLVYTRNTLVYATMFVTLASGVPYITNAAKVMRGMKAKLKT